MNSKTQKLKELIDGILNRIRIKKESMGYAK